MAQRLLLDTVLSRLEDVKSRSCVHPGSHFPDPLLILYADHLTGLPERADVMVCSSIFLIDIQQMLGKVGGCRV